MIVVDPVTGKEEVVASTLSQTPPTRTLPIAPEQLQQEVWAELLSLRDEQLQEILQKAAVLGRHMYKKQHCTCPMWILIVDAGSER